MERPASYRGPTERSPVQRTRTLAFGLGCSVGVHIVLAGLVLSLEVPDLNSRLMQVDEVSIDFIESSAPEPEVQPEPEVEPPVEEPPPVELPEPVAALVEPPPRAPRERAPVPDIENVSEAAVVGTELTPSANSPADEPAEPTADAPRDLRDPALLRALDPAQVAAGAVSFGPGPRRRGPPAQRGRPTDRPADAEEIGRRLSQGLRTEAMAKNYTRRSRPQLQRQADGSYAYSGHVFQARIRPDGAVEFEDRPGVQTNGFSSSGRFDLNDALMGAAGQDPHRAEREWFMRHTEELRFRLEREHRETQLATALRRLRGRLVRIWNTGTRSPEARRRRFFQIWDECEEGDSGVRARGVVIAFIRETIPADHSEAYSESELDALNAGRESEARFDPY